MDITVFDILRALFMFTIGGVIVVDLTSYFWHRFVEHNGFLGEMFRPRHVVHHEGHYPPESLRPKHPEEYKSAGSKGWYVLAGLDIVLIFLIFPLRDAVPLVVGGVLYARFVVQYFHIVFHIPSHWLHRFKRFKRLIKLHDIHHWAPCNYGIVFFWVDRIFKTLREDMPKEKEDIFPGYKRS
ncbi:sterol desaturase family protein [Patescibacteria group bacterium AH-259-L05]|nr:sterol desaturase family protein [Patescibacteria group bacterium AH-259-L05]